MVRHILNSPRQASQTTVRVLLPDDHAGPCRVLYLLPVQAGETGRWGDGLAEAARLDLHNRHRLICVAPSFSDWPWYADHPTEPTLRQESYFLQDVMPLIERTYAVQSRPLLVGFSKSGWGAFSLLLRHPDRFAAAAAFDAPLWMGWPSLYESKHVFGTEQNFIAHQPPELLRRTRLSGPERLMLLGEGSFQKEHDSFTALLKELHVPCRIETGTPREHRWDSGWLAPAVEFLFRCG